MRILFISNLYPPEVLGGYEILCARVVASFMARGHEVAVLTTAVKGQTAQMARISGPAGEQLFRTLRLSLPFGKKASLARSGRQSAEGPNARATRNALGDFKPDLVFVWSQLRLGLAAARESEAEGFPTVYTMNDDHVLGFMPGSREGLKGLVRSVIEEIVYPASTWRGLRLDPVISISETVRSRLASQDPRFAGSKIAMQGVPLELFPPKADIGAAHKPFRVLYAGQLHRYKGVHTLVEAVGLAGSGDFTLTVAGTGAPAYEAELKARAVELGLDARFLGRVAEVAMGELYREADVLAFTSVWDEPFGLTHLEAMASGTPVASVGHGGPGEFLVDDVNALIFGKEDPAGLADCLQRFASNEALRTRIALAGRDTVVREFSIERYADRLEKIFVETIEGRA
jgi:glycosyltransferase involved in cell wall biosynthesis